MTVPTLLDDLAVDPRNTSLIWKELDDMSMRLALLLRAGLPGEMPLLITGDWGAGKTSLLHRIRFHLDPQAFDEASAGGEETTSAVPTVWFDAWRYEHEPSLLAPLVYNVAKKAMSASAMKTEEKNRHLWNLCLQVVAAASSFGVRLIPKMLGASFDTTGMLVSNMKKEIDALGDDAPSAPSDPTETLRDRFQEIIDTAWPTPTQRPVVFIDDLDRCGPNTAVALIEGIRGLVAGQRLPCRFVIAMDRYVLTQAIQGKFASIGGYDGNRYLEKVFPLTFAVPSPGPAEVLALIDALLPTESSSDSQLEDRKAALSKTLSQPVFANPRLIKRSINRMLLVTRFEAEEARMIAKDPSRGDATPVRPRDEEVEARSRDDLDLARWIVTIERWPIMRYLLHQRNNAYWSTLTGTIHGDQDTGPLDPEGRALLEERGAKAWLTNLLPGNAGTTVIQRYRAADDRLRKRGM